MTDEEQKKVFSKNLNRYIEKFQKTQIQIAKDLHINPQTINSWCRGKALPRMGKIQSLADYFGIEKTDLIEKPAQISWSGNVEPVALSKGKAVRIPVLGNVAAGVPIEAIEDILDWEEIPETMAKHGGFFGLKIKGSSMEPRIADGDVVIVRQQPDAESGEVIIATVNGDSATCKRLKKYDDGIGLISNNPAYPPMFFSSEEVMDLPVTILGKVMELRGKSF